LQPTIKNKLIEENVQIESKSINFELDAKVTQPHGMAIVWRVHPIGGMVAYFYFPHPALVYLYFLSYVWVAGYSVLRGCLLDEC
jgi:hypothetical protein